MWPTIFPHRRKTPARIHEYGEEEIKVKKALQKRNTKAGFSLAETLVAVTILVLISASALPAAMRVYRNAVDASNAQVLLTTTVNALRNELSTATEVEKGTTATEIRYRSSDIDHGSRIYVDGNIIMLEKFGGLTESWLEGDKLDTRLAKPLISPAMRQTTRSNDEYMTVTYTSAAVTNGYVKITGLHVARGDQTIVKMPEETELVIRVMSVRPSSGSGG